MRLPHRPALPRPSAFGQLLMFAATGLFVALSACPLVIREPVPTPPREGCARGATTCHEGHPWVCGPDGQWSLADRRCDRLGARCCFATTPYGAPRHACVPAVACLDDDNDAPPPALDGGAR